MIAKQTFFFGAASDIKKLIETIEFIYQLQYNLAGLFEKEELMSYSSLQNKEDIGIAKFGDRNLCDGFLVSFQGDEIKVRTVPQKKGGIKYAIDQQINPGTILFRPGGQYVEGNAIIEGEISAILNDEKSQKLFKLFLQFFKKKFVKIKHDFIGKEALILYEKGWRFTQNVNAPVDYDLKLTKGIT